MGVFSKNNGPETKVARNPYDNSFQNNLTLKMGYLYPCLCLPTLPGDTHELDTSFGLRFMPTAFPLQTKMKAYIDFFYVRNRNLYDGFKDWLTGVGNPQEPPRLSPAEASEQMRTCSLGDYLGLPSTIVGEQNIVSSSSPLIPYFESVSSNFMNDFQYKVSYNGTSVSVPSLFNSHGLPPFFVSWFGGPVSDGVPRSFVSISDSSLRLHPSKVFNGTTYYQLPDEMFGSYLSKILDTSSSYVLGVSLASDFTREPTTGTPKTVSVVSHFGRYYTSASSPSVFYVDSESSHVYMRSLYATASPDPYFLTLANIDFRLSESSPIQYPIDGSDAEVLNGLGSLVVTAKNLAYNVVEAMDVLGEAPLSISALPFRAYEQIYNSFYRDDRNNPLYVDGVFNPNVFLPTTDGGVDNTPYRLRKRNWEQDFLTTALPSPQFGQAPLVGLISSGVATFADSDGNEYSSQLSVGDDGDTVVGFATTGSPSVNRSLVQLAQSGISINDLRGVNSLQRYLEAKYRKGLRYRDQMSSIFGVDIKEDVLDMPEFIGSVTQRIDVSQINQTSAAVGDSPLGSFAGQLSAVGGGRKIRKYCDEHGFIIGILSVVPVPCYSQLLPKHFTKLHDPLEYWAPQFNHIGFQPIKYDEVCPLQAENAGIPLNRTFGYQRAWYEYLSRVDEVHGQFRTIFNNFVLSRVYNTVPSLNEEFLTVDPESLNDVFTVNVVGGEPVDPILGQIHFNITSMRPIPRFGIPRLE